MRTNAATEQADDSKKCRSVGEVCLQTCRKVLAGIRASKDRILAEWRRALPLQEHLLQLSLNEAEASAWQTAYPHLVFPTLALEKVHAVASWNVHQNAIWRNSNLRGIAT
jgi:hypothetical protein